MKAKAAAASSGSDPVTPEARRTDGPPGSGVVATMPVTMADHTLRRRCTMRESENGGIISDL